MYKLILLLGLSLWLGCSQAQTYSKPLTDYARAYCSQVGGTYNSSDHCLTQTKQFLFVRPTTAALQGIVGRAVLNYRRIQLPITFVIVVEQSKDCKIFTDLEDKLNYLINDKPWFFLAQVGLKCDGLMMTA